MAFELVLNEIKLNLEKIIDKYDIQTINILVEPSKPGFGDATSNVAFLLAKQLRSKPTDIATDIAEQYKSLDHYLISNVISHPSGNLNFELDWHRFTKLVLVESQSDKFGRVDIGNGLSIIVEHTSVNPNKALHIGHLRNMIIGDVISRILTSVNYNVHVLNYIDDLGLQIADIVVGFKHLGFAYEPPNNKSFDHYCGDDIYVQVHKQHQIDPKLDAIRKDILIKLEDITSEIGQFGQKITRRVLACQLQTCWNIGVFYDCLNFESHIISSGLWSELFVKLKDMNLIEFENEDKNAGCWVVRGKYSDKVIVRNNGTATYIAKDISYAAWKLGLVSDPFHYVHYDTKQPNSKILWKSVLNDGKDITFPAAKVITVIDSRQARLQEIITSLLTRLKSDPNAYVHLSYGSVTLSPDTAKMMGVDTDGKQKQMSGREGIYVSIDAVYNMLRERAAEETRLRNQDMSQDDINTISHNIAVGTLRYEMIKQDLDRPIIFDLSRSLSLTGDTVAYLMYTHARACRILEKSGSKLDDIDRNEINCNLLTTHIELELIKNIGMYPIHVHAAAKNLSPKVIARYCHDLSVLFNSFYEKSKVLDIDDSLLEVARLCLVDSFRNVIESALDMLGIVAVEKM